MLYDQRRNTVIIAFRGTKDPVDVITDITFFSTAFAPRYADRCAVSPLLCACTHPHSIALPSISIVASNRTVSYRPVVKADPKSEGTFSSNAAVLISRDPPSSLPPLFSTPSPSPPLEAESESAGGYPEGMEVHTGFLSSFER